MITVIAEYRAQPGRGDQVASVLAKHVAATRTEPGCLQFVAYRAADAPDRFVLYEQYIDQAAFEAHRTTGHFQSYIEGTVVHLLAERRWARYEEVDGNADHGIGR